MVNVTSILDRTAALEQKYAKYLEEDKPERKPIAKGDQYQVELDEVDAEAAAVAEEAAEVSNIRERAKVALKNADIRKRKAKLHERIAGLDALAKKGKVNKTLLEQRRAEIQALAERVDAIPDGGVSTARKKPGAASNRNKLTGSKASEVRIELGDMGGSDGDGAYYQDTEENRAFRQEFEDRKRKQDQVLDEIESGVGRLGDIATDMGQELTKQDKLLDEVEANMDTATRSVQTNNQKMKGVLTRIRSTRNFCIDIILITILLAVVGYIYTLVA